jgi:hypothetical protein
MHSVQIVHTSRSSSWQRFDSEKQSSSSSWQRIDSEKRASASSWRFAQNATVCAIIFRSPTSVQIRRPENFQAMRRENAAVRYWPLAATMVWWSGRHTVPMARSSHWFTSANGKLYVHGGWVSGKGPSNDLHSFDPVAKAWTDLSAPAQRRKQEAATAFLRRAASFVGETGDRPHLV